MMTVGRFVESNDGSALTLATVIIDLSPASRLMALEDTADTAAGAGSETTAAPKNASMPMASASFKVFMVRWYQIRHLSVNPTHRNRYALFEDFQGLAIGSAKQKQRTKTLQHVDDKRR